MSDLTVRNNFRKLHKSLEAQQNRNITYAEITEVTGIAASTLSSYAQGNVSLYNASTLARLCGYFDCGIGDLLYVAPADSDGPPPPT